RAAQTGRLWAWSPGWRPILCNRTRTAPALSLCRCTPPQGVQRIDLGAALAVILEAYPIGQSEKVGEALLEPVVAGDLAANVADRQRPGLGATDRLSWISATSCASPSRWRQCVIDERSNGSW